jgi:DNA-binding NarL/FixJ family response regulator
MSDVTFACAPWPISVGLISQHYLTRCGLQQVVEAAPHLRLIGHATNPAMAEPWLAHTKPQVVLIDADSVCDMAETVRMVRETVIGSKVVALCRVEAMAQIGDWNGLSLDAVVLTVQPTAVLIATIKGLFKSTLGHKISDDDGVEDATKNGARSRTHSVGLPEGNWPAALTEREREVIMGLAQGLSNKAIAALLCISPLTVRHHFTNIFAKLGVSGRQQLMLHGHRAGFLAFSISD